MTNKNKNLAPIKGENQYADYLKELSGFCALSDEQLDDTLKERIEHLSILLTAYEKKIENLEPADPISIIRIRMHERRLSSADVVPYFGSPSRVSEVLNGRRSLTLSMIRKISKGLDIPADFLVGVDAEFDAHSDDPDWTLFPIGEMYKRGWIEAKTKRSAKLKESMLEFFNTANPSLLSANYKRSITLRSESLASSYSRTAWLARVVGLAKTSLDKVPKFKYSSITDEFLESLAAESQNHLGRLTAFKMLADIGIIVIYEPSLKGASIDGAATEVDGTPIIGVTLRHDRLDHFWFTLMHEVCHVWKHLNTGEFLIDDFDKEDDEIKIEAEANRLARDILIPRALWRRSAVRTSPTVSNILDLARMIGRDPAIIAGRVRRESNNYSLFTELVGSGNLRKVTQIGVQA